MAADSLASLGRRTNARGGVQRSGRDFFMGHRERGRGRGLGANGAWPERGNGEETVGSNCHSTRDSSAKRAE